MEKYRTNYCNNFEEAKNYLFHVLSSSAKKPYGRERGIERTKYFMELIGNPQENIKTIHIAGTSGKGSVAYILSNLLRANEKNVGLVVSPHVYDVRERMQVNNRYISEEDFVEEVNKLIPFINTMDESSYGRPTYYEANLALAFNIFSRYNLDYVVLETGVGGLLDSTNVIKREDKLSVITALGLDHTEILGETIEEIAAQKAGIINRNSQAIVLEPVSMARSVIDKIAEQNNSNVEYLKKSDYSYKSVSEQGIVFSIYGSGKKNKYRLPLYGGYQAQNAALAVKALEYLATKDNFTIDSFSVQKGLNSVVIPARTEIKHISNRNIIIDSAHNPQKITAFFSLLKEIDTPGDAVIIFGTKKGKDFLAELQEIQKNFDTIIISGFFKNEPSNIFQSEEPQVVADKARELGMNVLCVTEHPEEALNVAIQYTTPEQPIIVTGSMYMIGELNASLNKDIK